MTGTLEQRLARARRKTWERSGRRVVSRKNVAQDNAKRAKRERLGQERLDNERLAAAGWCGGPRAEGMNKALRSSSQDLSR